MPPISACHSQSHDATRERSYTLLQKAREAALHVNKDNGTHKSSRDTIREALLRLPLPISAYEWQLDVGEALTLGLDCAVIAGTGAGKTLPFTMPLLADKTGRKMVLIISPLNVLEEDQADRFRKMGLTAHAVNAETYSTTLHQALHDRKHRAILTSAEMALEHPGFSKLLTSPEFSKDVAAVIIDEAHCVSQWGQDFRPLYGQLSRLRSVVPLHVPFLVTSATMPPPVLAEVLDKLEFSRPKTFMLNLGNDRPNIAFDVRRMKGAASDLGSLDFVVESAMANDAPLERTLIFVNSVSLTQKVCRHLQALVPAHLQRQIVYFHAKRSTRAKRKVMRDFRKGKINILCTTEAAGMGADIPDLDRVVQFMVPPSLSVWLQRAGRAGRAGQPAQATLLVERSVFQVVANKGAADKEEEDEGGGIMEEEVHHRKIVEEGLREWIQTAECRRQVADAYFNNPPRVLELSLRGSCCDNCAMSALAEHPQGDIDDAAGSDEGSAPGSSGSESANRPNENGKRRMQRPPVKPGSGDRRSTRLRECREVLSRWRTQCWHQLYAECSWGPSHLLPDTVLTKLAARARIKTLEDLMREVGALWPFAQEHGREVLRLLQEADDEYLTREKENQEAKKTARKAKTVAAKAEREAATRHRLTPAVMTPQRAPLASLNPTAYAPQPQYQHVPAGSVWWNSPGFSPSTPWPASPVAPLYWVPTAPLFPPPYPPTPPFVPSPSATHTPPPPSV